MEVGEKRITTSLNAVITEDPLTYSLEKLEKIDPEVASTLKPLDLETEEVQPPVTPQKLKEEQNIAIVAAAQTAMIPPKMGDPRIFTIPCSIEGTFSGQDDGEAALVWVLRDHEGILPGAGCRHVCGAGCRHVCGQYNPLLMEREKVMIPPEKSCIFLDGSGRKTTEIQWNDYITTATSPTFTSFAENLVVQGITFRNTHNAAGNVRKREDITPAIAARIEGDKGIFHNCGFIGLQDTLWDGHGRHLFTQCYIEGVIDVISGFGQSIYKKCVINIPINVYAPILNIGYITAQGKNNASESNGFVFIGCTVMGSGNVFLGRAYRPFSTVIFHLSFLPSCISPAGWNSWEQLGHE
ncbi:putative pectinesterase 52 [Benincasa hispida]|uniref:putative pectinesterase 52 n=1 Tax=Benincasa hispida TaxID=102211 RepID=UPI001900116F|nr:putative pectinesterase 52 [Benincasa hispida]